jgi:hypothetical protein
MELPAGWSKGGEARRRLTSPPSGRAAVSPGGLSTRGRATPGTVARGVVRGLPTRECTGGGVLARPGIRHRRRRGAGEGAARGEQGTVSAQHVSEMREREKEN